MRTGVSSKIIVGTKITRTRGRGTRWRPRLSSYSATSRKCHAGRSACAAGGWVGVLGGLIDLGGAEFWLPLLIGVFGFLALQAVRSSFGHFDSDPIQSVPRAIVGVLPASASESSLP